MRTVKVQMTCILLSGVTVTEVIKVKKTDQRAFRTINDMRAGIENNLGNKDSKLQNFTFGRTTIRLSELAAISFKELNLRRRTMIYNENRRGLE